MKPANIKIMEVCGTHTMAIARAGIKALLPKSIELVSGPGCPVCVTAQADIDRAIAIAKQKDVILTSFGDMLRVPGSQESLEKAKASGADVRIIYSCLDALLIAREHPEKKVVFVGVGFETTSPTIAATILQAKKEGIRNFYVLPYFKLVFPALAKLATAKDLKIDGFLCPGHVSVITGSKPYEVLARKFKKPCVITGFEATDILRGITQLVALIKDHDPKALIEYIRAVRPDGNIKAREILNKVFSAGDAQWRGLGMIKNSGLKFRKEFSHFDASKTFPVRLPKTKENKQCLCGQVIQGRSVPSDCRLFAKACTPQHPVGPCMVSSEGTCAAAFRYRIKER